MSTCFGRCTKQHCVSGAVQCFGSLHFLINICYCLIRIIIHWSRKWRYRNLWRQRWWW